MFEHHTAPVLPAKYFFLRLLKGTGLILLLISISLLAGVCGYHYFGNLPWLDALLNASMILGGMGPVDILPAASAKWFASFYALFSGLLMIGLTGILLAPIAHRVMHTLHAKK